MWRWTCRGAERAAALLVLAAALPPAGAASAPSVSETATAPGEMLLLAVQVNGVEQIEPVRAWRRGARVWLRADDWQALNLGRSAQPGLQQDGHAMHALDGLAGLRWRIDDALQMLVIDAEARAFATARLQATPESLPTAAPSADWGGFLNYDTLVQHTASSAGAGSRAVQGNALLDVGTFGPLGRGRASGILRSADGGNAPRFVRLDTTWTLDRPAERDSLRIGDAVSHAGAWGRALRFGGVQWATDFSLQPGFLSFPLPSLRGEAVLPSAVDVFVNNQRRVQGQVPAGAFELDEVPLVSGAGEVRMVVRDLLGRERVLTQPYYVSPALLRPGLRSFSLELGRVREDYGLASGRYGRTVASATERLGITEHFTRELRAELVGRQFSAGATGLWLWPQFGLMSASVAGSHGPAGGGAMVSLAGERKGDDWSGSAQWTGASRHFGQNGGQSSDQGQGGQAGQVPGTAPRSQLAASVGRPWGAASIGLSVVQQKRWDQPAERLLGLSVSHPVGSAGAAGLFVQRAGDGRMTLSLAVSMSIDARTSTQLSHQRQSGGAAGERGGNSTLLQAQHNPLDDSGLAWQVAAEQGRQQRQQAQAAWRMDAGEVQAGIAHHAGGTEWRAGASGSLAWLDGSMFAARRIDGSFALVEVADYEGVQVLHDNRPVARTDSRGRALLPQLRGNERNRISVDAADLPFDAEVQALERVVVPPARSGVVLRIPLTRSRSASFRLVDADSRAVPAGAVMQVEGADTRFPVGFDGMTFASGLSASNRLAVRWPGGSCSAELQVQGRFEDLPELGAVPCR